ncbi:MAG TPA: type VII secretion protein EccE, partial [Mycobacteriales bacterium]|nr:type VII secretion protein EccE [Mycobacteriales bacterium]
VGAPRPGLDRGRGQLGRFGIGQVVGWQVAAASVLLGLSAGGWWRWVGLGPAGAIVLLTLIPVRGRWLHQWIAMRWRFWWRVPRPVTDPRADPRLVPLRELLPDLAVLAAEGRSGEQLGIVQDGRAWVALVAVNSDDDLLPGPEAPPRLPVRSLLDVLSVDDIRLAAVQVLLHTVPAPSGLLAGPIGSARSYQELSAGRVPAAQLVWVALRLDPVLCPDAVAARGGGPDGVHRALRRCVARTVEVLEAAGIRSRGLDAEEVRSALAASAGVAPRRTSPDARHTGEQWGGWTCDGVVHNTYWLRRWPADPSRGMPELLAALVALPVLFTTLSLTLMPRDDDRVRFQAMARISCVSADSARQAGSTLHRAMSAIGFRAVRMDGEQAPAAVATMPFGGGAR